MICRLWKKKISALSRSSLMGNIMTAFGGVFREFALAVMEKLGFEVPAEPFGPLAENWTRDKLNFTMESEVEKTYWKNALAMLKRECPQFF